MVFERTCETYTAYVIRLAITIRKMLTFQGVSSLALRTPRIQSMKETQTLGFNSWKCV